MRLSPIRMLNIAFSAGIFPPDIGGPADFVPRLAGWLMRRGHVVSVVCWSDALDHDDKCYPFEIARIARGDEPFRRFWQTVSALRRIARNADVIFANTLDMEVHTAARTLRKPTFHKVVGDRAWETARLRGWYSGTIDEYQCATKGATLRCLDYLRTFPLSRADRIIAPSCYLATLIAGWNIPESRVQVIRNSTKVDFEVGAPVLAAFGGRTILTACRLVPWKGVDRLIAILAQLPNTRLAIAGEGPDRARLEALAREHGVAKRVVFLGTLGSAQVRALMQASDVFVLNSNYEGLPHVVLEAMAAGIPVVATNVGGTSEVITQEETGLLVQTGDDRGLLNAIRRILDSSALTERLASEARRRIEREFGEEACFAKYEAALVDVVGRRAKN